MHPPGKFIKRAFYWVIEFCKSITITDSYTTHETEKTETDFVTVKHVTVKAFRY